MTTRTPEQSPAGKLRARIADLEALRARVDDELTATRERLRRIGLANTKAHTTIVPPGTNPAAVRRWARSMGYAVGDRGRMPADVIAAYLHHTANHR